jgi:hypothetical protein
MLIRIGRFYFTIEGLLLVFLMIIGGLELTLVFGIGGLGLIIKHSHAWLEKLSHFFQ